MPVFYDYYVFFFTFFFLFVFVFVVVIIILIFGFCFGFESFYFFAPKSEMNHETFNDDEWIIFVLKLFL